MMLCNGGGKLKQDKMNAKLIKLSTIYYLYSKYIIMDNFKKAKHNLHLTFFLSFMI